MPLGTGGPYCGTAIGRRAQGQQLVENRTEAIHVRAHVRRAAAPDLGRAEGQGRSAQRHSRAEIGDKSLSGVIDQHIGEFEIAMDEAVAVRMLERAGLVKRGELARATVHRLLATAGISARPAA